MSIPRHTPASLVDFIYKIGCDTWLLPSGRIMLDAPRPDVMARLKEMIHEVGRDAVVAELLRRERESRERLAEVLGADHPAVCYPPLPDRVLPPQPKEEAAE